MELIEDLPAMLALFLCGVAGYFVTKRFGRPVIPVAKQAELCAKAVDDLEEVLHTDCARTAERKQASGPRQARRRTRSSAVAAPTAAVAATPMEEAVPVPAEGQAEARQDSPPAVSDRVARLLAKKAERKARKAALLQLEQEAAIAPSVAELTAQCVEDDARDSTVGSTLAAEVLPTSSMESLSQAEAASVEADSEPMDETEDGTSTLFSKASVAGASEAQELPEDVESGDAAPCMDLAATCSDDEQCVSEETASDVPCQWTAEEECSSFEDLPQWVPPQSGTPSQRWACRQDGWMRSFDDLISAPRVHAVSPMVGMWKGPCIPGNASDGVFTDGQQVYQPVQMASGQQMYTDGTSLFKAVCVNVPDSADAPSCPERSSCGTAQEQAFDPYDPLGLAGLREPSKPRPMDSWNTFWG